MDDSRLAEVPVIDAPCSLRWQIQAFLHGGECPSSTCDHRGWLMDSLRGPDEVRHAGALLRVDQPVLLSAAARKRHLPLARSILAAAVPNLDLYRHRVGLLALDIGRYGDAALLPWLLFDAPRPLDVARPPTFGDDELLSELFLDAPNPLDVANTPTFVAAVAAHGTTEMLSWLKDHGQFGDGGVNDRLFMEEAAAAGHRGNLRFLLGNGCAWSHAVGLALVEHGDLEVVTWAAESGCPFDAIACAEAAAKGRLDLLQCLRLRGWPSDLRVLRLQQGWLSDDRAAVAVGAARSGNLEVCAWVMDEGFLWNEGATSTLAKSSNPLALRWALDRRCPGSIAVCAVAAARGRLDLLESAAALLSDWPAIREDLLRRRGARYVCPAAEHWLRKNGDRAQ